MEMECHVVCVTGGAGHLGSWLIKKLLEKGYTVHATLRSLGDATKVGLLKGLPEAESRLKLFEADIYNHSDFERPIEGCEYVFHLATPIHHHSQSTKYKDTTEAAIAGIKSIVNSCIKAGTVKRLIYTSSMMAASPLRHDGHGFTEIMDESCWTPLNISLSYGNNFLMAYMQSKTLAEQEVLRCTGELEIVSLACGLVGGDTLLSYMTPSVGTLTSPLTSHESYYISLKFIEELLGKVPLVHIDDVCDAHIFCIEKSSIGGRFLCASDYVSVAEIAICLKKYCSDQINITEEFSEGSKVSISFDSSKLKQMGFVYKHMMDVIIDDSVKNARKLGVLN